MRLRVCVCVCVCVRACARLSLSLSLSPSLYKYIIIHNTITCTMHVQYITHGLRECARRVRRTPTVEI